MIGAGITGLACARRLAELHPNKRIIVLEGRAVAAAASGRNSGFAVGCSHFPGPFDEQQQARYEQVNRINQAGLSLLRQQVNELGIDCQWQEEGFYLAAADQHACAEADNFADYLSRLDIPHQRVSQDELEAQLGTRWYQTAVHVGTGALLQPAMLVRGLADKLPGNVQLFESSVVNSLTPGAAQKLTMENGTVVSAGQVFVCANFEAQRLGFMRHAVVGSTLAGSFTRQLSEEERASLGALSEWGLMSLHSGGATVRLTVDGRISIRNTAEYHNSRLLSEQTLTERQKIHRESFDNRFPQLRHVEFEYGWSGVEGISWNGTNFFGREKPGIFLAGGYNGSGVSRGTAFGTALAEYANDGQSQLITDCLSNPKARWLPPRPFLDIGAWFTVRKRFKGVGLDR